ncbi:MAG: formylglycine-generating enzyme family protein [Acidobacteria bacterium]|nr:formylglycine-generating enzyme family protein [Acidobacteriota bacterium]
MEFVNIPAGEFMMGCAPEDAACRVGESPRHKVIISTSFQMGKFEVTQAQWTAVMGSKPNRGRSIDRPVGGVSWDDIRTFMARMNALHDGFHYRLPTEAEWEFAASAGGETGESKPGDTAWYSANMGWGALHPVGRKLPNAWGLHDIQGNVWEWVQDWYSSDYYSIVSSSGPAVDPQGPSSGVFRVLRGGSYCDSVKYLRINSRFSFNPGAKIYSFGFRCVRVKLEGPVRQ